MTSAETALFTHPWGEVYLAAGQTAGVKGNGLPWIMTVSILCGRPVFKKDTLEISEYNLIIELLYGSLLYYYY